MVRTSSYRLTGEFVAEACRGRLVQGAAIAADGGVSIDSRTLQPGQAFFAIRGPRHDGHEFLSEAVKAGASGLVVAASRVRDAQAVAGANADRVFVVAVENPQAALKDLAAAWVDVMAPTVVAVTGSVGKTTTKDLIAAVMRRRYETHATAGNLNNEYGVPLTCLGLKPKHEVLVVEMGTSAPGEIARLCKVARPKVAVVTAVAPAHLEGFGDIEGVARAKAEIVEALDADGTAVLNADDPRVLAMKGRTAARWVGFGRAADAGVRVVEVALEPDGRTRVEFEVQGRRLRSAMNLVGTHQAMNAAAALAVATVLPVDLGEACDAIAQVEPAPHRMALRIAGPIRCLDDCYNASPRAMSAALETLAALPGARKVAILGDMLELGDFAETAHRDLGAEAAARGVGCLIAVGRHASVVAQAATASGMSASSVFVAPDAMAAEDLAMALLKPDDTVLVKASHGVGLERLADRIVAAFRGAENAGN